MALQLFEHNERACRAAVRMMEQYGKAAIVRGILPAPKYVTTVYQYQKDLARYQTRVDRVFAGFKADTSGSLKLLFCIDMLNEGVHVEGISGVILFRPTISPIVYKQQIARLDNIGMRWEKPDPWQHRLKLAQEYRHQYGDLAIPGTYKNGGWHLAGKMAV